MASEKWTDGRLTVWAATRAGGSGLNEDAYVLNPEAGIYGAIDGVTAMEALEHPQNLTSAYMASSILAKELQECPPGADLKAAVLRANVALLRSMEEAGVDLSSPWKRWGAVFAVFRVGEHAIDFAQAGDCMLFARYKDASVRVLTHNQVSGLERITLDLKRELRTSGMMTPEQINRRLREQSALNRSFANRPDGYAVLNGDPALAFHMEHGTISRSGIDRLYAVSDGMFHLMDYDEDPAKWEHLLDRLDELGIDGYIDELVQAEQLDPDCIRYIRHKKSDDKTAVIVKL